MKDLASFIAGDLLPLSVVDSPFFHSLMEAVNDAYQIPSRKHLTSKMLPERSATIQRLILYNLQKTSLVCVTGDLWSNRQLCSYFGITAHFITSCDWDLTSVMLSCGCFHGSHTADATMDGFQGVISEFDIFTKLTFTVTDSAANMLKAFSNPSFEKTGRSKLEGEESDDNYDDENDDNLTMDDLETLQFYDDLGNVSEHSLLHTYATTCNQGWLQTSKCYC